MTDTYDPAALYPCGITVFCDLCGTEVRGDFAVNDLMSKAERLAVARKHFADNEGWSCTADGDHCPNCVQMYAVTFGHERVPVTDPVTYMRECSPPQYYCQRCTHTLPDGIRLLVPWPCTTARILDLPTEPTP